MVVDGGVCLHSVVFWNGHDMIDEWMNKLMRGNGRIRIRGMPFFHSRSHDSK